VITEGVWASRAHAIQCSQSSHELVFVRGERQPRGTENRQKLRDRYLQPASGHQCAINAKFSVGLSNLQNDVAGIRAQICEIRQFPGVQHFSSCGYFALVLNSASPKGTQRDADLAGRGSSRLPEDATVRMALVMGRFRHVCFFVLFDNLMMKGYAGGLVVFGDDTDAYRPSRISVR